MSVDLKSKSWYLTYSRPINPTNERQRRAIEIWPTITLASIVTFLRQKGEIEGLIAAKEHHADGTNHFHAYVIYQSPKRVRRADYWDYYAHPNHQTNIRNPLDLWTYINKEGWEVVREGSLENAPAGKKKSYGEVLAAAQSSTEFMQLLRENQPRDFVLHHDRLQQTAVELFRPPAAEYKTPDGYQFYVGPDITDWLETDFLSQDRPKTLVLIGPTRLGKTMWARSLGDHNYMNHMFNLDEFNQDRAYLVLDDIEFDYIPARKAFFFGQKEFTLTDKYRKKKKVIWGKPTIYCCNTEPDWSKYADPYEGNIVKVFIRHKMWEQRVREGEIEIAQDIFVRRSQVRYHEDNN